MLTLKRTEEEDHQKRISNTRRIIDDLKAELAKVGDQPDVTPAINAINVELRRIQEERAKIEGEKADLRRERDNLSADSVSECLPQASRFPLHKQKSDHEARYDAARSMFHFDSVYSFRCQGW